MRLPSVETLAVVCPACGERIEFDVSYCQEGKTTVRCHVDSAPLKAHKVTHGVSP